MKKIVTLAAVLALVLSMGTVSAFAESVTTVPGSKNIEVNAKYSDGVATPTVYSVDIKWTKMEFTYSKTGSVDWNAADHSYTQNTNAGWVDGDHSVTVTNHSNAAVGVNFGFEKLATVTDNISGQFSTPSKMLNAGVEGKHAEAEKVTSKLTLSGAYTGSEEAEKVGTITVSLTSVV